MNDLPERIDTLEQLEFAAKGYQLSRLILTAAELDVFTALDREPLGAERLAFRLGTHPRATGMLLNALAGVHLLEKKDGVFHCGACAARHLSADSPEDKRAVFLHGAQLWESWSTLTACVRHGHRAGQFERKERNESDLRSFIGAMHAYGLEQAEAFVEQLERKGACRILDLGGGPGIYAITFCRTWPGARATLFDRAPVLEIAGEHLAESGVGDRIDTIGGDMIEDDLGGPYDLVWLSNVAHSFAPQRVRLLFRKIHDVLLPGGRFLVRDFVLSPDGTQPAFAALFALNMLVNTPGGDSYTYDQYAFWLDEAGFEDVHLNEAEVPGSTRVIEARRPE